MLKKLTPRHYTAMVQFITGVIILFWTESALVKVPAYLLIFMGLFTWRTAKPPESKAAPVQPDRSAKKKKKKKKR